MVIFASLLTLVRPAAAAYSTRLPPTPLAPLRTSAIRMPPTPLAPLRTSAIRMLPRREQVLHAQARGHCLRGDNTAADVRYQIATSQPGLGSGRSYLLAALHKANKLGEYDGARATFADGIMRHRTDAKLMQAWGLFESKHGEFRRAMVLLRRAVKLDASLAGVLRWRRFSGRTSELAMREGGGGGATAEQGLQLRTRRWPRVRYTVPQSARGWRGRPEQGEDPRRWYDAEGPRNGPPSNYWRQAMDEREHAQAMSAVAALLASAPDESAVRELEDRLGVRRPLFNRKLLGRWAPLFSGGARLAQLGADGSLRAPDAALSWRRAGARKTTVHRYGTFDDHLQEGERLLLELERSGEAAATAGLAAGSMHLEPTAERGQMEQALSRCGAALPAGRVTYLSQYLMVTRDEVSGDLRDVLIRDDVDGHDEAEQSQ
jgi:hypothetical protein